MMRLLIIAFFYLPPDDLQARFSIEPYYSISSTKKIKPDADDKEKETIKQRETVGLRGGINIYRRLFKFSLAIGENTLTTTEKTSDLKDDFDEIDYEQDTDLSTDDPELEVKTTEVQRRARAVLSLNPSFSIFVIKAKAGVQATQRILTFEQTGLEKQHHEPDPTYKPLAGIGLGIRFTSRTFFMTEYSFYFYKFPEVEPFEREVSVSFGLAI